MTHSTIFQFLVFHTGNEQFRQVAFAIFSGLKYNRLCI
uniref:Uncharacterized protein n=1 Tax=Anguilla anguilla TaxID=7936 RepID=A0A0E9UDE0_ANGAN